MARDFAAKSDRRNQSICLQQVLRFNPKNLEACQMMGDLTETVRSPSALGWRQRVLDLKPKSVENQLAFAKTAMVLQNYGLAAGALDQVDSAGRQSVAYHNLAGTIAMAAGQRETAASHFSAAARLEPWNSVPQLNLALVQLLSSNTVAQVEARASLRSLSLNSTNLDLRCQALRELVGDALRSDKPDAALTLSSELLKQTKSTFSDRLLRLVVLKDTKQSGFSAFLAEVQNQALGNEAHLFELATWQLVKTGPAVTIAWMRTLPPNTQTNPPIAEVIAEARTQLQEWPILQSTLQNQKWGDAEFIRYAFLTRANRGLNLTAAAKATWGQARQAAGMQRYPLATLLQLAARWKWSSEAEEILWTIVNQYPEDQMAFQGLAQTLYDTGRTRPLMNLYALQVKRKPSNLGFKNDLAMIALLLDAQELKPQELAREVYLKAPTNAAYASTYGFALHASGKSTEALDVFKKLSAKELETPAIAGYYGLVLQATGSKDKARVYLDWAFKSRMLPEEKKLFERARQGG